MGWRFTLVSAALLAAVVAIYYLDTTPPPPPRRVGLPSARTPLPPAPSGTPLVTQDAKTIERMHLALDGVERVTERTNGGWTGTDRPELIEEFARDLTRLGPLEKIELHGQSVSQYGLQPPRGRIELHLKGRAEPIVYEVGNLNPPGTALYVRRPGESEVLLVGSLIHWELQRNIRLLSGTPVARE
ncbi:MAG: hypothetical protein KatS3mg077_0994 [Candidatus Binatia bacterium]|nr:MAG: hypothetical protein KatS3mg077_0994 [Candidatus Binatia bacterium]